MTRHYQHWINGQWQAPSTGKTTSRTSPAHGELLAEFADGSAADLDKAVQVARAKFDDGSWSGLPASERAKMLEKLAALIDRDAEKLSRIEAEEVGKPIKLARGEIGWSAELTRFAAALAWQIPGNAHSHNGPDALGLVTREPRGVIGMIVPWNYPMVTLFQKLPYALAAGCTVVVKPSELTSGTALELAQLVSEAGIPDGVFNVVTGFGKEVGEAMSKHAGIDMVSFTGSTVVGKRIAANASDTVKPVALELGGKSPMVVFADADLEAALDGVLFGFTLNQGEECVCGGRLIIEKSIANEFVSRLVKRAQKLRIGLPLDEATDIGSMIHEQHFNKVMELIRSASDEGATLRIGGEPVKTAGLEQGYFVPPTIFSDVRPDMRIFREEVFGPVLAVTTFDTVDEAVALANDTSYGLAGGVWSKNIDKAIGVSRRIKAGTVWVNTYFESAPQMPFGGVKQSGVGRENGLEGLLEFMNVKSTFVKMGKRELVYPHAID